MNGRVRFSGTVIAIVGVFTLSGGMSTECDPDRDGVLSSIDNCDQFFNPVQLDTDNDGFGDACDVDDDNDGWTNTLDCAPTDASRNPSVAEICDDGVDNNCDGVVDLEDPACVVPPQCGNGDCDPGESPCSCPADCGMPVNENCFDGVDNDCDGMIDDDDRDCQIIEGVTDTDKDGIDDDIDNCRDVRNSDQSDLDSDGEGDACDDDADGDGDLRLSDCDDLDPHKNSLMDEICGDGIDNDCDDHVDEDDADCGSLYVSARGTVIKASLNGAQVEAIYSFSSSDYGFGMTMDHDEQYLYVFVKKTSIGFTELRRVHATGGTANVLFSANASTLGAHDIAFSEANSKLYWTAFAEGAVYRSDLNGNIEIEEHGEDEALGVACIGDLVYWSRETSSPTRRHIKRGNLLLGGQEMVVSDMQGQIFHLALDNMAQRVYWTDDSTKRIWSATLEGGDVENVFTTEGGVPVGIAVDPNAQKLYWVEQGPDRVRRANLDGTNVEDLITNGINSPHDIVLDLP